MFFKKKPELEKVAFTIENMHCTGCAMNIDGELEDTKGVATASTSFAQSKTVISYDPTTVTQDKLLAVISALGYTAKVAK